MEKETTPTTPHPWQRTIHDADMHEWIVTFFGYALAERQVNSEARRNLAELILRFESGDLEASDLLAWSLQHLDAREWKIVKTRASARIRRNQKGA